MKTVLTITYRNPLLVLHCLLFLELLTLLQFTKPSYYHWNQPTKYTLNTVTLMNKPRTFDQILDLKLGLRLIYETISFGS